MNHRSCFAFVSPLVVFALLVLSAGCRSRVQPLGPSTAAATQPTMAGAELSTPPPANGVLIDSVPEGGVVVVDGLPVGPTPLRLSLPVNKMGYLSRPVSLKVRFVAESAEERSSTTEVLLTPLDRLPERIEVTPTGSRRQLALQQP